MDLGFIILYNYLCCAADPLPLLFLSQLIPSILPILFRIDFVNHCYKTFRRCLCYTLATNIIYICHEPPVQITLVTVAHVAYLFCLKPTILPHHYKLILAGRSVLQIQINGLSPYLAQYLHWGVQSSFTIVLQSSPSAACIWDLDWPCPRPLGEPQGGTRGSKRVLSWGNKYYKF